MPLKKEKSRKNQNKRKICLLGASFRTGNMGVSALTESSIKVILRYWPDVEIILLGVGNAPCEERFFISGREVNVKTFPVRFSRNIFLPYHFIVLFLNAVLLKVSGTRSMLSVAMI